MNKTLLNEPVSLVLLARNEAEIIEEVVRGFYDKVISKIPNSELIIGEDGSTDGTKEILARLEQELPGVKWLEGTTGRGYQRAWKDAILSSKNERVLFCDSSGKHAPNDFWTIISELDSYDLVLGFKINRNDPWFRIVMTRVFNYMINKYFQVDYKDINCPMRAFRLSKLKLLLENGEWHEKHLINYEMTLKFHYSGLRILQVPVRHFPRQNGESRGLPVKTLPKVIKKVLNTVPRIKASLKQAQSANLKVSYAK